MIEDTALLFRYGLLATTVLAVVDVDEEGVVLDGTPAPLPGLRATKIAAIATTTMSATIPYLSADPFAFADPCITSAGD